MAKKIIEPQPIVRLSIRPGPASPAQKQAWKRFWQKLIAEAKSEAPSQQQADHAENHEHH